MSDRPGRTEQSPAAEKPAATVPAPGDDAAAKTGILKTDMPIADLHWVSARMATEQNGDAPWPASDAASAPEPCTISDQIETLRRELALASRDASVAAAIVTGHMHAAGHGRSMPRFLRDQPTAEENVDAAPVTTAEQGSIAHAPTNPDAGVSRSARPYTLALGALAFVAVAVCAIVLINRSYVPHQNAAPAPVAEDSISPDWNAPSPRLSFVGADGCANRPCEALLTFTAQPAADAQAEPKQAPAPAETSEHADSTMPVETTPAAKDAPSTDAVAQSATDPLNTVTIRGLPPTARLSLGQRISDSEWAFTLGDMKNVDVVLPPNQTDAVRADIEIKARDGRNLAAFALNIQHEAPAVAEGNPDGTSAAPPPEAQDAPIVAPVRPVKAPKAKNGHRAKVAQPLAAATVKKPIAPSPPSAVAQSQTQPPPAAAPVATSIFPIFKAPEVATGFAAKPAEPTASPTIADQAPGFEILRTLGGGFGLQDPQ